jgi:hypothetical protein
MKRLLLITVILLPLYHAHAQSADQQKAWTDYMTPGEVHKILAKSDGTWNYEMSYWMAPGTTPMTSNGTAENKMVLGGRYQESVHKSNMGGMDFEGHGLLGYDNAKKTFQYTWIDNMGTGSILLEGKWDDATSSITLTGKGYDPITGKDIDMKEIIRVIDDNHQVVEMYTPANGKEFKNMEIKLTRKM